MKIKQLSENVEIKKMIDVNQESDIESLSDNSKTCRKNSIFFCISGYSTNGQNFVKEAVKNGAVCVVTESELNVKIPQIIVKNVRETISLMSANFYQNAHKKLKIISIIGTNGKTSTSYILKSILESAGKKVGIIGTSGVIIGNKKLESDLTTPDPITLHKIFSEMQTSGIEYAVMEVSAHAIYLNKVFGIVSDIAIFTNVSQDHLDFFGTMENYTNVKKSFFNKNHTKSCIVNVDDDTGRELLKEVKLPIMTYGIKNPSDIFAINISMRLSGSEFFVNACDEIFKIRTNLSGLFNVYNILSAICVAKLLSISNEQIQKGIEMISGVEGRFNLIDMGQNFNVVVDYAHTPESLKNLLGNIKNLTKFPIITVFGCPGNRDETKRAVMGEIAGNFSDYVIVTTDNPLYENQYRIMRDIESGVVKTKCGYRLMENRSEAISLALSLATPKSTVVVAGKGVETYQNINGIHIPYNDFDEIKRHITRMKKYNGTKKFLF